MDVATRTLFGQQRHSDDVPEPGAHHETWQYGTIATRDAAGLWDLLQA